MKIAVAMSGGVDSSVAAHILAGEGHEVFGLTMKIWACAADAPIDPRVCCGPAAIEDAGRVARELGIPHYVVGMRGIFEERIVEHFISEYARGRTPNPCVRCNRLVKFESLLTKALSLGASHLATGHHAVIRKADSGTGHVLERARDSAKDQSYFLYSMNQEQLARVLMPVGGLGKEEVRARARRAGLHVAERPESQDTCFVPRGDIASFVAARLPEAVAPGPIEDLDGKVLGSHRGLALYTVGQRSGLGLARPRPTYVVRIDPGRNVLVVGEDEDLYASRLVADELSWIAGPPPAREFTAEAKIRYAAQSAPCVVRVEGNEARVTFAEPQRAIAPGQAVVLYDGRTVLGGGTIASESAVS